MLRVSDRSALALALTLLVALVACGDDDGVDDNANPSGTQPTATSQPASASTPAPSDSAQTEVPNNASEPTTLDQPAADTPAPEPEPAELAPEFVALDSWHNSEPLTLAGLRGSPVLLVFWADF